MVINPTVARCIRMMQRGKFVAVGVLVEHAERRHWKCARTLRRFWGLFMEWVAFWERAERAGTPRAECRERIAWERYFLWCRVHHLFGVVWDKPPRNITLHLGDFGGWAEKRRAARTAKIAAQ